MAVLSNSVHSFSHNEAIYDFKEAKHHKESKSAADLKEALLKFSNTPIGKALENDPVWQAASGKAPEKVILKPDIENFFLLIFKFMKADHSMNSQLQLSSVANMIAQNHMLDTLSSQAVDNMAATDASIKSALDNKPSIWLTVVLPVALMIVGAAIGCFTGGAGEVAADGLAAGVDAGAEAGANAAAQATEKVVANVAAESVEQGVSKAAPEAVDGAAEGAGDAAGAAGKQAEQKVVEKVGEQAEESAAKDAGKKAAEDAGKKAGDEAGKKTEQTLGQQIKEAVKNPKFWGKVAGFATAGLCMGAGPILTAIGTATGDHHLADFSGMEIQKATTDGSAKMNIISSATEAAQGREKQETQSQQNAASNAQADLSMMQQMIQSQQQAFGFGKL